MNPSDLPDRAMDAVDIFSVVCDAPAADRARLLAELCGTHAALRRELERMLEGPEPRPDLRPGAVIAGRYRLIDELGGGATASVWRASDRKMGRQVALKIFRPTARRNWRQVVAEARALANVDSDHVIRVHDVSAVDDEHLFIDLQLCREFDAQGAVVKARPLSTVAPRSALEAALWLEQAARGVEAAHLKNVFHRDLKPQNLLVGSRSRWIRVTDFGHGLRMATTAPAEGAVGDVVGTPAYMAPEQAAGIVDSSRRRPRERRRALTKLDVYGLGAVGYFLLTGRAPHGTGDDDVKAVIEKAKRERPPPLRARPGLRVPDRLRRIVERAMAPDPVNRYASAADLADDLLAFREDRCSSHDGDRFALRGLLWTRRHRAALSSCVAAAALAVALGAAAASATWGKLAEAYRRDAMEAEHAAGAAWGRLAEAYQRDAIEAERAAGETSAVSLDEAAALHHYYMLLFRRQAGYRLEPEEEAWVRHPPPAALSGPGYMARPLSTPPRGPRDR